MSTYNFTPTGGLLNGPYYHGSHITLLGSRVASKLFTSPLYSRDRLDHSKSCMITYTNGEDTRLHLISIIKPKNAGLGLRQTTPSVIFKSYEIVCCSNRLLYNIILTSVYH